MAAELSNETSASATDTIQAPAPTAWPIVLAFGIALVFAGMLTSEAVSVLGAILAIAGVVGWFRDVLPHEAHESVRVEPPAPDAAKNAARSSPRRDRRGIAARLAAGGDPPYFGGN